MSVSLLLFDVALAILLVVVGLRTLLAKDLFQSIVSLIVFGLLISVAWCRLEAVDVALAEAAIGAGLTGALLLNTLAATRGQADVDDDRLIVDTMSESSNRGAIQSDASKLASAEKQSLSADAEPARGSAVLLLTAATAIAVGIVTAVAPLMSIDDPPSIAVASYIDESGAANPVTAVLLNFRAYDTLLEVAVLLCAAIAVLPSVQPKTMLELNETGPVLQAFVRWLTPIAILVGTYVLWNGAKAPGGAFQAAALLAAAGVLLLVCGWRPPKFQQLRWRSLLSLGLTVFLLVGFMGILRDGWFLRFRPPEASLTVVVIETALTISIAFVLLLLFRGTSIDREMPVAARRNTDEPMP